MLRTVFNAAGHFILDAVFSMGSKHESETLLTRLAEKHAPALFIPKKRIGPMLSVQEKLKDLAGLENTVAQWREDGAKTIGITSGVFDIVHPGHASFLEDAKQHCDRLIVIIASNRTVSELKGPDKPRVPEDHRAMVISALGSVDAVIISDEFSHENILKPLHADVMFKGHDYADKDVWGKEWVGRIEIVPCAEDKFYSSSHFIKLIKGEPVQPLEPSAFG